jgi:MOSC domain-containing protein YiiM
VGSRLQFDQVLLEVTAPRIPCNTLAQRMDDPGFARQFVNAERPGIYCRVLQTGAIRTGETFAVLPCDGETISTLDMFRGAYRKLEPETLRRFLAAPIDLRSRQDYQQQLNRLEKG